MHIKYFVKNILNQYFIKKHSQTYVNARRITNYKIRSTTLYKILMKKTNIDNFEKTKLM